MQKKIRNAATFAVGAVAGWFLEWQLQVVVGNHVGAHSIDYVILVGGFLVPVIMTIMTIWYRKRLRAWYPMMLGLWFGCLAFSIFIVYLFMNFTPFES